MTLSSETGKPPRKKLLAMVGGALLLLIVLATVVHGWWIRWPERLWLSLGAALAVALAVLLARRRPAAVLWVGGGAFGLLLLVVVYLHGTGAGGLRLLGLYFDDLVGALFVAALGLAVWRLARLPILPWWGRWIVGGLGVYAAVPVVMGLAERIVFGEILVGLWTLPYWLQGAYLGAAILLPVALVVTVLGLWLEPLRPRAAGRGAAVLLAALLLTTSLVCAFEMNSRGLLNALSFLPGPAAAPALAATAAPPAAPPEPASAGRESRREERGWQEIFIEVRDSIDLEPRRSALRSPEWVARDGRGNSLEQARLLAQRLAAAGERPRFVEGTLDQAQAARLVAAALPAAVPHAYPQAVPVSRPAEDPEILGRLASHYWIQIRQGGEWLDLDPSFRGAEPGARFAEPTRTWDRLPAELVPSLALRVELERRGSPGRPEPLLSWEGRFDELANAAVGLVMVARVEAEQGAAAAEPGSGHNVFGSLGGRAPKPAGGAEARSTVYEATLAVGDAVLARGTFRLGGGPLEAMSADAIDRIDLRFRLRHPDGRRQEVIRPLFEADGAAQRPPLFQRHSVLLTASRIPGEWFRQLLDATLSRHDAEAARERLDRLESGLEEGGDLAALYRDAVALERSLGPAAGHLLNLAFASVSDQLATEMGRELSVFHYYEEPRILINTFQGSGRQLEVFFDLRQDGCVAIPLPGQATLMRESFLYGRGVLESVLEGRLVELFTGQRPLTTAGIMMAAAAEDVPIVMYSRLERSRIDALELPPRARRRVLAALDGGKIVALPSRAITHRGTSRWGWWEIEPTTREAVGVLDTGLHQATVQRTLIESEGALDEDMAWVIGAIAGATDTQWVLAALILEYGELNQAALEEAKAYLKQIGEYLCSEIKVGEVWETGVTVAEVKAEIEGCWEEGYSLGVGASAGAEITILDKGWCEGFQKGFTCASMSILNAYLADA